MNPSTLRTTLLCAYLGFLPLLLSAHPAWGIAFDHRGTLWFADAVHDGGCVWAIESGKEPKKTLSPYHAHSLCADMDGSIFAAQSDYQVDHAGVESWLNELVCWRPDGSFIKIISTKKNEEFWGGAIAIDNRQNVWYALENRLYARSIAVHSTERQAPQVPDHQFGRIVTLQAGRDGCLNLVDNYERQGTLFRIDPDDGQLTTVADSLLELEPTNPPFPEPRFNLLFGTGQDYEFNLYVANSGSRCVWELAENGQKTKYYQSSPPWYPVGIAFREDRVVVMEAGYQNANIGPRLVEKRGNDWVELALIAE